MPARAEVEAVLNFCSVFVCPNVDTNRHTDRQTDTQELRQTDRQTDRKTLGESAETMLGKLS